jgi:hypothetical protein
LLGLWAATLPHKGRVMAGHSRSGHSSQTVGVKKRTYRVKVGLHSERGVVYGLGLEAGDKFTTSTDLHEKLDPDKEKFELLS